MADAKTNPDNGAKKTLGRNEPCPCGSGEKYKNCCASERMKALRLDLIRHKQLVHILLMRVNQLTGAQVFAVPIQMLQQYPKNPQVEMAQQEGNVLFRPLPLVQKPVIQPIRRLIVPN